jgi:hypothetical protein
MTPARLAFSVAAALLAASVAFAQAPRPAAPPPPPIPPADAPYSPSHCWHRRRMSPAIPVEPQVTIIQREDNLIEEVRVRGELQYIKVTPRHGRPYFLIPDTSGTAFIRRDSLDIRTRPAMWMLFSW